MPGVSGASLVQGTCDEAVILDREIWEGRRGAWAEIYFGDENASGEFVDCKGRERFLRVREAQGGKGKVGGRAAARSGGRASQDLPRSRLRR